jgi:DNA-binding LytR/AlgR family response regulator
VSAPAAPVALIAEDEPLLADALRRLLAQAWPELEVAEVVHDGEAALRAIESRRPDVAFLDIRMPQRTGLQVAEALAGAAAAPPAIVFVTAFDEYAVQAFDAAAVDYLLKPVTPDRLARCVARVRARLAAARADDAGSGLREALRRVQEQLAGLSSPPARLRHIRASVGDVTRQIPVDDVLWFEAQDKYVAVVTRDGRALVRVPLSELLPRLDPDRFTQIHRSTVVAVDAIESIRRDFAGRTWIHLRPGADGREIRLAVSRAFAAQFRGM